MPTKSWNTVDFAKQKTMPQAGQSFEKAAGEKGSGFYWAAYETTYFAAVFKTDAAQKSRLSYQVIKQPQGKNQAKLYSYMVVTEPERRFSSAPRTRSSWRRWKRNFPT